MLRRLKLRCCSDETWFKSAYLDVGRWEMCDGSLRMGLYKEVHLGQWLQVCVVVLGQVTGSFTNNKNRCSKLIVTDSLPVKSQLSITVYAFLYMLLINSFLLVIGKK